MKKVRSFCIIAFMATLISTSASAQVKEFSIGGATVGGADHSMAIASAQCLNKFLPGTNFTAEVTAGTDENLKLMNSKKMEFGVGSPSVSYLGYQGLPPFKQKIDFRVAMTMQPKPLIPVVLESSGIKRIEDLKGKRIAVGPAGGGRETGNKAILEACGLPYTDIKAAFLRSTDTVDGLADKKVDAAIMNLAEIEQVAVLHKVVLLSHTQGQIDRLMSKHPYFGKFKIPAGTFKNVDYEALAVDFGTQLFCRTDLEDNFVYQITRTLIEHLDFLKAAYAPARYITREWAAEKRGVVPFHPGAIKYYKEIGAWKN
jgi:uncharacterized protein